MNMDMPCQRDTDFVRENMLYNYCLENNEANLIKGFILNNQLDIHFHEQEFYFLMIGVHKRFLPPHSSRTFNLGWTRVSEVYQLYDKAMTECGYSGNSMLIKVDNSKQFGVIFSPEKDACCTPQEMAYRLYQIYSDFPNPYHGKNTDRYNSASFCGPYQGLENLNRAFKKARALNDLIFFGVRNRVITEEYRKTTSHPCDVMAVQANIRRLLTLMCEGTQKQAVRQANYIIDELIAPSYEMKNIQAFHLSVEDMFAMFKAIYPVWERYDFPELESFYTLAEYKLWLNERIAAFHKSVENQKRYSPTLTIALSFINRNFTQPLSLTQIAEYVYSNPNVLSGSFNSEVGISLSEYVNMLRIRHAKELLENSAMTVTAIAEQSGFMSVKYFRELFKRQIGMSPQEYREHAHQVEKA